MIDIEEDAVEPAARRLRVEPVVTPRQGKEIGFDETRYPGDPWGFAAVSARLLRCLVNATWPIGPRIVSGPTYCYLESVT